jgi:hypothetical protein
MSSVSISSSSLPQPGKSPRSLQGLKPFLRPYKGRIAMAVFFLVMAAITTRVMALREHFFALFGVGVALGVFSAARFYMVSWLGERVTADLRKRRLRARRQAEPGVLRDHADRRGAVAPDHRHDAGPDGGRLEPVDGPAQRGDGRRRDGDAGHHQPGT